MDPVVVAQMQQMVADALARSQGDTSKLIHEAISALMVLGVLWALRSIGQMFQQHQALKVEKEKAEAIKANQGMTVGACTAAQEECRHQMDKERLARWRQLERKLVCIQATLDAMAAIQQVDPAELSRRVAARMQDYERAQDPWDLRSTVASIKEVQ